MMLDEIDAIFERIKSAAESDLHTAEADIKAATLDAAATVMKDIRRIAAALETIAEKFHA